ncbi:MAG: VanZ family protein, partial [Pseudomonadota bacterium]
LRTKETRNNGTVDGSTPLLRVPKVFRTAAWKEIDLRVGNLRAELFVDGELEAFAAIDTDPFRNWTPNLVMTLGNEISGNRPWLGEIAAVEIQVGAVSHDLVTERAMQYPHQYWFLDKSPKYVPLTPFNLRDSVRNIIMYVPLGLLFGLRARSLSWPGTGLLLVALPVTSIGMETLQLFFGGRTPSIDDVIFNAVGGSIGLAIGLATRRVLPTLFGWNPIHGRR